MTNTRPSPLDNSDNVLLEFTERVRLLAPPWIDGYAWTRDADGIWQLEIKSGSRRMGLYADEVYRLWVQCMTCDDRLMCRPPLHDYC